jgi:hypothetical protein
MVIDRLSVLGSGFRVVSVHNVSGGFRWFQEFSGSAVSDYAEHRGNDSSRAHRTRTKSS